MVVVYQLDEHRTILMTSSTTDMLCIKHFGLRRPRPIKGGSRGILCIHGQALMCQHVKFCDSTFYSFCVVIGRSKIWVLGCLANLDWGVVSTPIILRLIMSGHHVKFRNCGYNG